jgi:hypothetical protein
LASQTARASGYDQEGIMQVKQAMSVHSILLAPDTAQPLSSLSRQQRPRFGWYISSEVFSTALKTIEDDRWLVSRHSIRGLEMILVEQHKSTTVSRLMDHFFTNVPLDLNAKSVFFGRIRWAFLVIVGSSKVFILDQKTFCTIGYVLQGFCKEDSSCYVIC